MAEAVVLGVLGSQVSTISVLDAFGYDDVALVGLFNDLLDLSQESFLVEFIFRKNEQVDMLA